MRVTGRGDTPAGEAEGRARCLKSHVTRQNRRERNHRNSYDQFQRKICAACSRVPTGRHHTAGRPRQSAHVASVLSCTCEALRVSWSVEYPRSDSRFRQGSSVIPIRRTSSANDAAVTAHRSCVMVNISVPHRDMRDPEDETEQHVTRQMAARRRGGSDGPARGALAPAPHDP